MEPAQSCEPRQSQMVVIDLPNRPNCGTSNDSLAEHGCNIFVYTSQTRHKQVWKPLYYGLLWFDRAFYTGCLVATLLIFQRLGASLLGGSGIGAPAGVWTRFTGVWSERRRLSKSPGWLDHDALYAILIWRQTNHDTHKQEIEESEWKDVINLTDILREPIQNSTWWEKQYR